MKLFNRMMLFWSLALPVSAFVSQRTTVRSMPILAVGGTSADSSNQPDDAYWNAKYKLLQQFHGMYEHHHVPVNWGDTELRGWVLEQAELVNSAGASISTERRDLLAAVGIVATPEVVATDTHPVPPMFVRDPFTEKKLYASMWEQRWEDMYLKLCKFKEQHDGWVNCNTLKGYQLDLRLAEWVQIQRENLRLGTIRSDRQQKLEQIGVEPLRLRVDGVN